MFGECCPECGHLLSTGRNLCPVCDPDEHSGPDSYSLRVENDLSYQDSSEISPDQVLRF